MSMSTKLIIFDFDGTLGNTRRNIVVTMQDVMQEMGLAVQDESTCAATIGMPLRGCYAAMFPNLTAAELDRCAELHRIHFAENLKRITPKPFPQVIETIHTLRELGVALAIASSRTSESLRELTASMGMARYFQCIIGAGEVAKAKPNAEPVLKVLAETGFKAEDTLVVGDMDVDILMGRNARTKTCGVTWGNGTKAQLEEAGADCIIDSMEELLEII